jgi:hypothetical protein
LDLLPTLDAYGSFQAACAHATLAGLAGRTGSGISAESGPSEAEAAMALLAKAVRTGDHEIEVYRTDEALAPLRSREDFKLLMLDLAMPADPFAAER